MSEEKPIVEFIYGEPLHFPAPVIFPDITRRQLRLWLHRSGVPTSAVMAALDAIQDPDARAEAIIEWEDATVFQRSHPLIESIGAALGMTSEQLDAAWMGASHL